MKNTLILIATVLIVSLFSSGCQNLTPYGKRLVRGHVIELDIEPKEVQVAISYFGREGGTKTFSDFQSWSRGHKKNFRIAPELHEWRGLTSNISQITISKEGYYPKSLSSEEIVSSGWSKERYKAAKYTHPYKIVLKKNPNFGGPTENPTKIKVTFNSEPTGAKVYEEGKQIGVTPCTFSYDLQPLNYQTERFLSSPLTIFKEGYIVKEKSLVFEIIPEWKYHAGEVIQVSHDLTILNPDPNYQPKPIINNYPIQGSQEAIREVTVIQKDGNVVRDFANTMSALDYLIKLAK